jgi:hypothetical protein
MEQVNEGNENYCGLTISMSKWIDLLYLEKLRNGQGSIKASVPSSEKISSKSSCPFLGCGGVDKAMVNDSKVWFDNYQK